jgi:hypothetical protein
MIILDKLKIKLLKLTIQPYMNLIGLIKLHAKP